MISTNKFLFFLCSLTNKKRVCINFPFSNLSSFTYISLFFTVLLKAFQMFDPRKSGFIEKDRVRTILTTLDFRYDDAELGKLLEGEDEGKDQV